MYMCSRMHMCMHSATFPRNLYCGKETGTKPEHYFLSAFSSASCLASIAEMALPSLAILSCAATAVFLAAVAAALSVFALDASFLALFDASLSCFSAARTLLDFAFDALSLATAAFLFPTWAWRAAESGALGRASRPQCSLP